MQNRVDGVKIVLGNTADLEEFLKQFQKHGRLDILTIRQKYKIVGKYRDKLGNPSGLLLIRRVAPCTAQLQLVMLDELPKILAGDRLSRRGVLGTAWINVDPLRWYVFGSMIEPEEPQVDVPHDDAPEVEAIVVIKRGRGRPRKNAEVAQ